MVNKDDRKALKRFVRLMGLGVVMAMLVSACAQLPFDFPWWTDNLPTTTPKPGGEQVTTPTPQVIEETEVTDAPVTGLTIWVPPEMDPSTGSLASQVFSEQLQLFSEQKDGLEITVRVKAAGGTGGLLDALTATSAAAPDVVPDLIALTRPDLEIAALKGLIYSVEGLTDIPDDSDWYGFTKDMALLQGETFGFPFAADSLVLVYRPEIISDVPATFPELIENGVGFGFSAESDQALFPLTLYMAMGGAVQDNQRRPMLEVEPLAEVFRLFQAGIGSGTFSDALSQYQSSGQVWTAFKDQQIDMVVTWTSNYLKELPEDAVMIPLLPVTDTAVSLGTGMSWAVATPVENRQALAVELAEFLVQPEFLSDWTLAAGYLPTRPSALEGWGVPGLLGEISQIELITRLRPSNDLTASLGPILREGTRQVLLGVIDPAQAAQVAVENLEER